MFYKGFYCEVNKGKISFPLFEFKISEPMRFTEVEEYTEKALRPNPNYDFEAQESADNPRLVLTDVTMYRDINRKLMVYAYSKYAADLASAKALEADLKNSGATYEKSSVTLSPDVSVLNGMEVGSASIIDVLPPEYLGATADEKREALLTYVNQRCSKIINDGVVIQTSKGEKKFSITEEDKSNMMTLKSEMILASSGAPSKIDLNKGIPYHANGDLCTLWTPEEFNMICDKCTDYVLYQTTYCNHLRYHIKNCDETQLPFIFYGCALPAELQESMAVLLGV